MSSTTTSRCTQPARSFAGERRVTSDTGMHAATGRSFTVLRFSEPDILDVVYTEHFTSVLYLDKREERRPLCGGHEPSQHAGPDLRPDSGACWLRSSGRPRVISWYHPDGLPGRQQTRNQPSPIPQTATR